MKEKASMDQLFLERVHGAIENNQINQQLLFVRNLM